MDRAAVAIGAATPAFAASQGTGNFSVPCTSAVLRNDGAGSHTYVAGVPSGTRHTWNLGYIYVDAAPPGYGITGFKLSYGDIRTTDVAGNVYTATNVTGLVTTAQAVPYGVSMAPTFQTSMSYAGVCQRANQHVVKMELDFCITWLRVLNSVNEVSQQCCYRLTQIWDPPKASSLACAGATDRYNAASGTLLSRTLVYT
jgi:hypothetical protein